MSKLTRFYDVCLVLLTCTLMLSAVACAMHPEMTLPEKLDAKNKASQEIMRVGKR